VTGNQLLFLLPHLVLIGGGVLTLIGARLLRRTTAWGAVALLAIVVAAVCVHQSPATDSPFAGAVNVAFLFAGGVLVLGAWNPMGAAHERLDTHGLILCGVACAMLVAWVDDAVLLLVLLELCGLAAVGMSPLVYRLQPADAHELNRNTSIGPAEAGTPAAATGVTRQALILQAVSAALLLLAVMLICFDQQTTSLSELREQFTGAVQSAAETGLRSSPTRLGRAGFVLLFAAVAVKAFLVPFHFGAPEVLTRSSTTACSYALTVSRGAALIVLFRVGIVTFAGFESPGLVVSAVLSGGTMLIGTALAVGRERLRETLTYLFIGHGGTVLFGLCIAWGRGAAATELPLPPPFLTRGETAAGLTLLSVSLSVLGAFSLLNSLRTDDRPVEYVEELTGLLRERPLAAAALAVLLLNLVGVPPLPGFWSRLLTWTAALAVTRQPLDGFPSPHPAFLILSAAMGVQILIAAGVLFRIVAATAFEPPMGRSRATGGLPALLAGGVCTLLVVVIGFLPSRTIAMLNSVIPQSHVIPAGQSTSAGSSRSVMRSNSHAFPAATSRP